jgi:hypothetical protein
MIVIRRRAARPVSAWVKTALDVACGQGRSPGRVRPRPAMCDPLRGA